MTLGNEHLYRFLIFLRRGINDGDLGNDIYLMMLRRGVKGILFVLRGIGLKIVSMGLLIYCYVDLYES